MAYITGQKLKVKNDDICENIDHHDGEEVKADVVIVGECDSFGYERFGMCQACYKEYLKEREENYDSEQHCGWCHKSKKGVTEFRDWEEGSHGPVYEVCADCRAKSLQDADNY